MLDISLRIVCVILFNFLILRGLFNCFFRFILGVCGLDGLLVFKMMYFMGGRVRFEFSKFE